MKILKIFCLAVIFSTAWVCLSEARTKGHGPAVIGKPCDAKAKPTCAEGKHAECKYNDDSGCKTCTAVRRVYAWQCVDNSSQPFDCEKYCPSDHSTVKGRSNRKQCRKNNCTGWETPKIESTCRNCRRGETYQQVFVRGGPLQCVGKGKNRKCPDASTLGQTEYKCMPSGSTAIRRGWETTVTAAFEAM